MTTQTTLIKTEEITTVDLLWKRAAIRECILYEEHGQETEVIQGRVVCFNCGGKL